MVGKLERVNLREVWIHEAKDFTAWLSDNLETLSDQIDYYPLSFIEREKAIEREGALGSFSADILAETPDGEYVIIENQLEKTDHDHLGKLITYLSNLNAKTAIWITSYPRPEHINAINWLNESRSDTFFFLIQVEAYKIGNSEPAPLFTAICRPSVEAKEIGEKKQELAERHIQRMEFWKQLLEKARQRTPIHSNVSPSKDNWLPAGAGKSGMAWSYSITLSRGSVELFVDLGAEKEKETKEVFEKIHEQKEQIEERFGEGLVWDVKEGRRVCRIKSFSTIGGLHDTDLWDQVQDDMIDRMVRLEESLRGPLAEIKI